MSIYSFTRGRLKIEVWPSHSLAPHPWVALPEWHDGEGPQAFGDTPEDAADELEWMIEEQRAADEHRRQNAGDAA